MQCDGGFVPNHKNGPKLDMETRRRLHFVSIVAVGAKEYVTFCKKHVFFGRGVEGKEGKGDRVKPIPDEALTRRYP